MRKCRFYSVTATGTYSNQDALKQGFSIFLAGKPRNENEQLQCNTSFSGALAKLRKATVGVVMSVRLSVRMGQLGSHWTNFLS
jgi:hypothetical protein